MGAHALACDAATKAEALRQPNGRPDEDTMGNHSDLHQVDPLAVLS